MGCRKDDKIMSTDSNDKICYTMQELYESRLLPLGVNKLYELASKPGFPAKRIGLRILVSREGLIKWMADNSIKYV